MSFGAEEFFVCHTVGFGSGTGGTGCPTGLGPWLPCDGRNQRCPLVARNRLIEREVPPAEAFGPDRHLVAYGGRDLADPLPQHSEHQQLDRGRYLVAYPQTSFCAFASTRGGSDATAAPARLDRGRRSDRRSPVWPANVVDWPVWGLPTGLLLTELLLMAITSISKEDLSAAQAFHRSARKSTTRSSPLQRAMTPGRTSIRKKE